MTDNDNDSLNNIGNIRTINIHTITINTNTYTMDPAVYPAFGDNDYNLIGFGLVSTREVVQAMGRFESGFMLDRISYKGFVDVDNALTWAQALLADR